MLNDKIQQNLIIALKSRDTKTVAVLRYLQSALKNKEIDKRAPLSDEEIIQIIRKQIKELNEAKSMFEKGGRADLVRDNEEQIKILQTYLPAEISDDELKEEIKKLILINKEIYDKNSKAIIGICMAALKTKASPTRIMDTLQALISLDVISDKKILV